MAPPPTSKASSGDGYKHTPLRANRSSRTVERITGSTLDVGKGKTTLTPHFQPRQQRRRERFRKEGTPRRQLRRWQRQGQQEAKAGASDTAARPHPFSPCVVFDRRRSGWLGHHP